MFCDSHLTAQKAIIDIGKFLSKRGLNLQGAKTRIYKHDAALIEFDGVSKIIGNIQKELLDKYDKCPKLALARLRRSGLSSFWPFPDTVYAG